MVAPGDNLEFQASGAFRDQVRDAPEILVAVKDALRRDPKAGQALCGELKRLDLSVGGEDLVLFIRRRHHVVSLLAVHLAEDVAGIERRRRQLCEKPNT